MKHTSKPIMLSLAGICLGLSLALPVHARVLIKTGVAYAATAGKPDKQHLRQRAMRDAMEQALREANGEEISVERRGMDYSRSLFQDTDGRTHNSQKERSSFHLDAKTRLRGSVQVLEVIREQAGDDSYRITLKLDVQPPGQAPAATPGTLWRQVGRPDLSLTVEADRNAGHWWPAASFSSYIRRELADNELEVLNRGTGRYDIRVAQSLENQYLPEYGTWKSLCDLQFSIRDTETGRSPASELLRGGPVAGFSEKEAADSCLHKVSARFSSRLLESLSLLFQEQWLNGRSYHIRINHLPGIQAARARQAMAGLMDASSTDHGRYANNSLELQLAYRGQPLELAEQISVALEEAGLDAELKEIHDNQLVFDWRGALD